MTDSGENILKYRVSKIIKCEDGENSLIPNCIWILHRLSENKSFNRFKGISSHNKYFHSFSLYIA